MSQIQEDNQSEQKQQQDDNLEQEEQHQNEEEQHYSKEHEENNNNDNNEQQQEEEQQEQQQEEEQQQEQQQQQEEKKEQQEIKQQQKQTTQGDLETTTQRKEQNKKLETEKQQRQKTTTERTFKTLEQIYSKRNMNSMIHLRTAEQFDTKIIHDQINRSHAKQLYSFAKAERFTKPKESYCSMQFYDSQIQTQLGKRSAALGYGTKSDFTKKDKYIPGPTDYNIRLPLKPGVKFAFGREETNIRGIMGRPNINPAPNLYEVKDITTTYKYSMAERTNAKHIYLQSTTPAPGRYNVGGFSEKGNYFIGRYKSSGAPVISPSTAQSQRIKRIPGPGTYDPPGDIGDLRTYLPSQFSTRSGNRFGYQERQTQIIQNKKFPGPGTYQLPSEFGDYEYPPLI